MAETRFGFAGADDPAYAHEQDELAKFCAEFLAAHKAGDFDVMLFVTGKLTAQTAKLWLLSPAAGILDPATMFARPGEEIVRVPADEA